MGIKSLFRDTSKIAKLATITIFLALVRSIAEPFRLQYYSKTLLTFDVMKPFLLGSLIASIALLAMTILFYFGKYKIVIATCILTIIILLLVKKFFLA